MNVYAIDGMAAIEGGEGYFRETAGLSGSGSSSIPNVYLNSSLSSVNEVYCFFSGAPSLSIALIERLSESKGLTDLMRGIGGAGTGAG